MRAYSASPAGVTVAGLPVAGALLTPNLPGSGGSPPPSSYTFDPGRSDRRHRRRGASTVVP
jgi:hypothetical protein